MAARRPIIRDAASGEYKELPAGDTVVGAGAPTINQVEVDFGALPLSDATFTIVDASVVPSSHILAQVAWEAPTGKDLDEIEMDDLQLRAQPGTGQFKLFVRTADGSYLADRFKINYLVG